MVDKTFSPEADAERHFAAQEAKHRRTKFVFSDSDILDGNPIEIRDDVFLIAKAEVIVIKREDDELEVDHLDIGPISIVAGLGEIPFKLDQDEFKSLYRLLYEEFRVQVELRAIQAATKAPESAWCPVDTTPY